MNGLDATPPPDPVRGLIRQAYEARAAGDRAASLRLYREAAGASAGDPAGRAHCLRHIGDLEREAGRLAEAREALHEAELLYRSRVRDTLSLANNVRLLALLDEDAGRWTEARSLYEQAGAETGLDLEAALRECDRHLGR